MKNSQKTDDRVIAENRQARHEYFIEEAFEAGIELKGSEVKSIRAGGISLKEGYAHVRRREVYLEGVHIAPYEHSHGPLEPIRSRRLLLHRREILRIDDELKQKKLTLVPLRVYLKSGRVKLELGLARGKKLHDKRASIKKREVERELAKHRS